MSRSKGKTKDVQCGNYRRFTSEPEMYAAEEEIVQRLLKIIK
jgi:hypothetical protein